MKSEDGVTKASHNSTDRLKYDF